jgi:predicted secreted protein
MTITGAIVLFSVIWFMVFLCILPTRQVSQGEAGQIEPGTPASAPMDPQIGRKARLTTWITLVLWAALCLVIWSEVISIRDTDFLGLLSRFAGAGQGE